MNSNKLKFALLLLFLCSFGNAISQNSLLSKKIRLSQQEGTVRSVLEELSTKQAISLSYSPEALPLDKKVQLPSDPVTVENLLLLLLPEKEFEFIERNGKVIIKKKQAANNDKITLSGSIRDVESGEELIGATLILEGAATGVASNTYGFYSLTLPTGSYRLICSFIGYSSQVITIELGESKVLNIDLIPSTTKLTEVQVVGNEEEDQQIYSPRMGFQKLGIADVKNVPTMFGEVDVVKAVQLLPGVLTQGEGSTNIFVRGGSSDHNIYLLDEAPVYNPSHLLGFFSIFNSDAVKDIRFFKGDLPAAYGGRLASLLDVHMKEGNNKKFGVSGGIGTISSRLTIEGPLSKEKGSFILSGRRTYADLFLKMSQDEYTQQTSIFFYDFNAKLNYKLSPKDRLYASGYFGKDLNEVRVLRYKLNWSNATGTLRWNHIFNDRLFSNVTLLYSRYDYLIDVSSGTERPFSWKSDIEDISAKLDFTYFPTPSNTITFGASSISHKFNPGSSKFEPEASVPKIDALEHSLYLENEQSIGEKFKVTYGLRLGIFQLLGGNTVIEYDENHEPIEEKETPKGEVYKTYTGLEPRVNARYLLNEKSSLKANYNRTYQYMQMLSNSSLGFTAFDIWMPASSNVKPQSADQAAFGYFRNMKNNMFEASAEVYYKKMYNQLDYTDHAVLLMNRYLEGELRSGKAEAYGAEFMLKKKKGEFTGWASYTFSRVKRTIAEVNDGKTYPANYDQPHSFSFVGNYELSKRVTISANWVYNTGRPVSLPVETYRYEKFTVPVYKERNGSRLPDYHRLDLSLTLKPKFKPKRKNESSWNFTVYNVYNRANAITVFVSPELSSAETVGNYNKTSFYKLSFFGILPSMTYNFNF